MNLQSELNAEKAKTAQLEAEVKDLRAKLASAPDVEKAKADAVKAATDPLNTELTQVKGELSAVKTENESLKKAQAEFDNKVNAKALEITQAQGVPPVKLSTNETPAAGNSAESLWAQYKQIKDPNERNAFYKKHRAILNPYK